MSHSLEDSTTYLEEWSVFKEILSSLKSAERIWIRGVYGAGLAFLLAGVHKKLERPLLVVLPEDEEASTLFSDLKELVCEGVFYLPPWEFSLRRPDLVYEEALNERVSNLYKLLSPALISNYLGGHGGVSRKEEISSSLTKLHPASPHPIVVTPLRSLIQRVSPPISFLSSTMHLKVGENKRGEIIKKLDELNYERKEIVEERGCWALRGSILDIFPNFYDDPLRIEFIEDKIESIRYFDPTTQKSTSKLQEIVILPRRDIFIRHRDSTLLSYLPENTLICLKDSFQMKEMADKIWDEEHEAQLRQYFLRWERIKKELSSREFFYVSRIPQKPAGEYNRLFSLPFQSLEGMGVSFDLLERKVREWQRDNFHIYFLSYNEGERGRLEEILRARGLYPEKHTFLKIARIDSGFLLDSIRLVILTNKEIFSRYKLKRPHHKFKGGESLISPLQIQRGDYVVHVVHGIGKYLGLTEFKVQDEKREFLMVEYEGGTLLYVPVEGLHLLHRYIGLEGKSPELSRLGSSRWRHEKEKVMKACHDVASSLLHMEAVRRVAKGFSFAPDTEWQKEFEASFIYEETEDQLKAIKEVKEDMEKETPMDRLLCGDAGYGKTEVALRATFKAVMNNKQVAVLVPTTLLAEQHWLNFKDRMKDYPISTEMLSRFKTLKEQRRIIRDLKEGRIDIIIGTHRLLQDDLSFKQLGLVIIDEEQRFGVTHKEKLKALRKTVDVMTLTATPIPRTLYMALSGIRDMSMINTPPRDRLAVRTYVAEFDKELIREAIINELSRGGQVFFLHNRVKNIRQITEFVKKLVPEAKVQFAHGQMRPRELEKVMLSFIAREIDVLVTTTIIESGLDIPNANTIIINEAHQFGIADLYQLRGRVGRYRLQAYAYLLIPPKETLTPEARKRLRALEEFSYLGSGFQLAMQDLQIRGAGNLLGEEQHGHIMKVGLELYMKLLKEAVDKLRGKKVPEEVMATVDLGVPAYIPSSYISEERTKLSLYKRIAEAKEEKELSEIHRELKDRFGHPPLSVKLLLDISKIRITAESNGIDYVGRRNGTLVVRFIRGHPLKEKLQHLYKKFPGEISVTGEGELKFPLFKNVGDTRRIIRRTLELLHKFS
ncbi:MAG TPA: transcription-repair coupling factor [Candidatus Omnitrophica bacterium]|nr:transcription-repair coupling factor [Candidatus Omnitrophota bacterium]